MRRLLSDRLGSAGRAWLFLASALLAAGQAAPLAAQSARDAGQQDTIAEAVTDSVIGAAVSVGDDEAVLELELSDGRSVQLALENGIVYADGETLGQYDEQGTLERSWRDLLEEAAMASTVALPAVLRAWDPPVGAGVVGRQLDERLEQALAGIGGRAIDASTRLPASVEDSIEDLLARIHELEARRHDEVVVRDDDESRAEELINDVVEGIVGFVATLVWLGVMFGVGAAVLFFASGRLERVAATVREEPLRSGLIGLAGTFLAVPFYVLVTLALAISILGIPLILGWAPLFPLLFVLAGITGWLAVAYSAGDALVAGKLSERPRFQNTGSFGRLAVGIAVLLAPFFIAALFRMTHILDWVGGLLFALGIVANLLVAAIGFGAVLTRGRDALDRQRERRAAARRARAEQTPEMTPNV